VPTFRELLDQERPLVLPGSHDALTARLIERAGFKGYFIGGFPLVGARYAVPDIGLMSLGEISAGVRDIMAGSQLPVLVDCDNGYGDVKTAVHSVQTYERLGVQAVFLEDQISPKRCGHISGKQLMTTAQMVAHMRAIVSNRMRPDTFLIARTDAREVYGMDEALRRGEAYLAAGADGLFLEAPVDERELTVIAKAFDVPLLANMLEGGRTPILPPAILGQMGYRIAIYGISALRHAIQAMQNVLSQLAEGRVEFAGQGIGFEDYKDIVGFQYWADIENRFVGNP
jgi:2-methylisocitrate lyase-like PEP mutase family enzyme